MIPYSPRSAASISNGKISVDLDQLDLDYEPDIPLVPWQPSISVQPYEELSKIYIDLETTGLDPERDRLLLAGMMDSNGFKTIITNTDEKKLLKQTIYYLTKHKPNCLIGHNSTTFDLPFISRRCEINNVPHPFKRGSKLRRITSSSVNGKPIEFIEVTWRGVNILDTYQQIAIWDKAAAKLSGYGLKNSVLALGLREDRRLELTVDQIRDCWDRGDTDTIAEYLEFDLDDTKMLADFLLPVVYYQMSYVPNITFGELATASPALKAQKIHQQLLPDIDPIADEPYKYDGGKVELLKPGLHHNVAKIDVSSLYPSIMLRYGICSRKDKSNLFLGVLDYMRSERLRLKALAKGGDKSASFQEKSLKVLINGSYGFFGTGGYSYNDYQAAALVTAYGRKILDLMVDVVVSQGGIPIEIDTDGVFFSHTDPDTVADLVTKALPKGIEIELEMKHYGLFVPKAKSYVMVSPSGKTSVKGLFRKRNRYPLQNQFPTKFIGLYFTEGLEAAEDYYLATKQSITDRQMPIEELITTRKIAVSEKGLVESGIGTVGQRVSYWYGKQDRYHARTGKPLTPVAVPVKDGEYWTDHYLQELDEAYWGIIPRADSLLSEAPKDVEQLTLF